MNSNRITLTAVRGSLAGKEFVFEDKTRCTLGRADDCDIQMPMDLPYPDVSRHHCMLEIDPPYVQVRDLGSRNGTFVNGTMIGQRPAHQLAEDVDLNASPPRDLREGDEIQVGHTVLRVGVNSAEPSEARSASL
jgi:pSer/pThr/pTyr-binding forkhead associated (FHA) protein